MPYSEIILSLEGPVGRLTLNRPEKVNSLSIEMIAEMTDALDRVGASREVRVLILDTAGKHFCAGHMMAQMVGKGAMDYDRIFANCAVMMKKLHSIPQPVIAKVQGVATAAGCQLAAACDLVVASQDARFATPGVHIGLFCSTPAVPLVRSVGRKRALEMLFTGRFVGAEQALDWGLVNRVVPSDELEDAAMELAQDIASHSAAALAMGKRTFYDQVDRAEPEAYNLASIIMGLNLTMEDAQEGISAFLEKRTPTWKDR